MVLTITTAGIEACPGSSRGPREKGVEMLSNGVKEELASEVEGGKQLEGKKVVEGGFSYSSERKQPRDSLEVQGLS